MKELAKEELKILEAQHPTRFQYLKLELKEFIHLLDQEEDEQSFKRKQQKQKRFHLSTLTQESSSRKRDNMKLKSEREEEKDEGYTNTKRRRTEEWRNSNGAIQRAEACLRKIQTLKSYFCSSNH